jgi:hypothetical protein
MRLTLGAFVSEASRELLTQALEHRKCRSQKQDREELFAQKTEIGRQRQRPKRQLLMRCAKLPVRLCSARKTNFKKKDKKRS